MPAAPKTASGLVENLTKDLKNQKLDIPGFPDIAMRLNRALQDENVAVAEVVSLTNSEPALVSRLIGLSNSAAFNASNQSIADLKTAVGRLGFKIVWGAAASYSIRQLATEATAVLEATELWGHSFLHLVADCHDEIAAMRSSMG